MNRKVDVLIIGGGIIGASCAYELSRRGAKVALIDKGQIGHACSYGNAGWLTPCFAMPLPMPGMLLKSMKWLLHKDSPLYIQPRLSMSLASWLWQFMRAMNHKRMTTSVEALVALSKLSFDAYQKLHQSSGGAFGFTQQGLLMVAQSNEGMEAAIQEMDLVSQHQIAGRRLNVGQIIDLEPAIRGENILGGVYFPDEAHVEPLKTVEHLVHLARRHGATVHAHTEVLDLVRRHGKIETIRTTAGDLSCDRVVLATGAWTGRIARSVGLHIPMLSGKGYALIVPPLRNMPTHPIMIIDRKVAITPRADSLRIAGTMELVDLNESVTLSRVEHIVKGARTVLDMPEPLDVQEIWRGLRPCTPDGVPVIGKAPRTDNLFVAAGHQMLGLQTGLGTGMLLADLMTGAQTRINAEAFRLERFQ